MASSASLRERSKNLSKLLCSLSHLRSMGGGPRTFPGGLNKWQYKRMHEKMAREKQRRLLQQEKQLYYARLRSEIRAKLAGKQTPASGDAVGSVPMSSKDHIKALADRFMKAGAEDLWNEDDGPLNSAPKARSRPADRAPPLDLRKMVGDGRPRLGVSIPSSFEQRREYSAMAGRRSSPVSKSRWRHNSSSDSDSDYDVELLQRSNVDAVTGSRFSRFRIENKDSEEEAGPEDGKSPRKKMMSGAALRNHDLKKERRPLKPVGEEVDLYDRIQAIRDELKEKPFGNNMRQHEVREESLLTQNRFDECNISPLTTKALSAAGYTYMTVVQEAAIPVCLEGKDAIVKARTGTGKTMAFLLPTIETVIKTTSNNSNQRVPPIVALVIAPTRELAIQIAAETNVLLRYHDGIGIQTLIGGSRFKLDQKRLELNPCQIIVATPGRLLDHIENKSGFSVRLMGLKLLVLDEVDHLLDLGFRKDIEKIVDCVPRQRQSLLFSATISKEVRRISQLVLKRDHVFVDTVGLGGLETHTKVSQTYLIVPHNLQFYIVHHLLKEHITEEVDFKVIVFCTTAMVTEFLFVLLRDLKMNVREIHSRKPQLYRTRIADEFRDSKRMILVTSDVSARGVNYPDVTLVIQVGIPPDREQYIHRLGRTGRRGKDGKGILLLAPWEEYFMDEIKDLPLQKCKLPELDSDIKQKVEESIAKVDTSIKEAAYHAWLGYYNSIGEIGRDKTTLVELANQFCGSIGLEKPPALFRKTALKMGLKDIPGIRIRK